MEKNILNRLDARGYQILALGLFLGLGIGTRDWTIKPELIAVIFITCLSTQAILATWHQTPNLGFPSAIITSLGLSLLLRSDHASTMMLASFGAIASKFIFRLEGKHWFNPANFGIVIALIFTNDAWVSPGQWGDEVWYALIFLALGGMVLKRVGRWETTAAFLGTYTALELGRNLYLGWTWDVLGHRLMSGSLLLFALFMITDPRSIPNARSARLVWAVAIAIFTFILRNFFFLPEAVFYALFLLSPLTLLLDYLYQAPRFSWSNLTRPAEPNY